LDENKDKDHIDPNKIVSKEKEMVILVGLPSSGKSTFTLKHFVPNGYVRINRDTMGTMAVCKKKCKEAFEEGKSVIVDNTNPSKKSRQEFISIAKQYNVQLRCFYFNIPMELAEHLNYVRNLYTKGETKKIPVVAFRTFNSHYEEPTKKEGFSEINEIHFNPDFTDPNLEKLYKQYSDSK